MAEPLYDDFKESAAHENDIDQQFQSKLHFTDTDKDVRTPPKSPKKSKHTKKASSDINAILRKQPKRKKKQREPIPKLSKICLDVMYQNIPSYDSFDFLPQDLACELLMMVVDNKSLTPQTARPFLNTKHELIKLFFRKYINVNRLPVQFNSGNGCHQGYDRSNRG